MMLRQSERLRDLSGRLLLIQDEERRIILERLNRGERIDHFETVRMRKDGTTLDISLTISPVRDAKGKIVSCTTVLVRRWLLWA